MVCSVLILRKVPRGALEIYSVAPRFTGFFYSQCCIGAPRISWSSDGTITQRKIAKGVVSFRAQIRLKEGGKLTHSESKTFARRALAQEWLRRCEAEIEEAQATGPQIQGLVTLKQILQDYVSDAKGIVAWGRSKTADIALLQKAKLAHRDARHLCAIDFVDYVRWRRTEEDAGPCRPAPARPGRSRRGSWSGRRAPATGAV